MICYGTRREGSVSMDRKCEGRILKEMICLEELYWVVGVEDLYYNYEFILYDYDTTTTTITITTTMIMTKKMGMMMIMKRVSGMASRTEKLISRLQRCIAPKMSSFIDCTVTIMLIA